MEKVFEDEFMELHSSIIDLCRELTRDQVDTIYAYCSIEGRSYSFNAFFTRQNKAVTMRGFDAPFETKRAFLRIGTEEVIKIDKVCKKHSRPTPTQIKMVYDVKTRRFTADYQYQLLEHKTMGQVDYFMDWVREIDPTYK